MQSAESDFDAFTRNPGADQRQWMRDHYARMKTWAPYFDSRLDWYPNAWAYRDAYAIYPGSDRRQRAPGVDPQGRRRQQALHPVGLQRRHLPAVRRRHRQPGLPRRLDRRGPLHAGPGLQGHLHRRREHAVARRRRRRPQRQGDRPAHRPGDDRGDLAALHGRLHGAGPRGLPGQGDRPQRDLVRGRHARHPAPAARRRRGRPRARLQRHRAHQRHRPLVVPGVRRPDRPRHADGHGVLLDANVDSRPSACTASPPTCSSPTAGTCSATARRRAPTAGGRATTSSSATRSASATSRTASGAATSSAAPCSSTSPASRRALRQLRPASATSAARNTPP